MTKCFAEVGIYVDWTWVRRQSVEWLVLKVVVGFIWRTLHGTFLYHTRHVVCHLVTEPASLRHLLCLTLWWKWGSLFTASPPVRFSTLSQIVGSSSPGCVSGASSTPGSVRGEVVGLWGAETLLLFLFPLLPLFFRAQPQPVEDHHNNKNEISVTGLNQFCFRFHLFFSRDYPFFFS